MLHSAIMGAFRARGTTFEAWCAAEGLKSTATRNVTHGQSHGPKGRKLLEKLIDDAGREIVQAAYEARLKEHYREVAAGE